MESSSYHSCKKLKLVLLFSIIVEKGDAMFDRLLQIAVPSGQSLFLWGARQTGKSSFLQKHYPDALRYDLLDTQLFLRYLREPYLFRAELLEQPVEKLQQPIIIDEIQKIPVLLNEVHLLIEQHKLQFILCGSSARQLKAKSTNLLGGRAWIYHFYPLVFPEIPAIDLLKALQQGLLPKHYLSSHDHIQANLEAYVNVYLTDEIQQEGLVRNLAAFSQFLEMIGLCNGELINMSNIARDCRVTRNTVEGYFQILVDTLLGYFIYPYHQKVKRDLLVAMPKFYLFDVGVANYLGAREVTQLKGDVAGRSFEHFILMELIAYRGLLKKRFDICYWRTKTGLEVDFVLGDAKIAIEVKVSTQVHKQDLKGLVAFCEEHPAVNAYVVSQDVAPRQLAISESMSLAVLPWRIFLEKLWAGEII
jgi:predicted AAA+ superfamily ATPase